ncbi:hypothetical protein [Paenibacillus sp. OAS669]|uniref:hypothetical protein n=1 Tax=Paenibacillus sp. OAS669 TaxID=2663821 RepID=UPI0017893FC2|nr:hypothetical protein [Paenibacillus sp. OAS669]MBE1446093.1 vacuolar-type H+-ATPase subunit I/STV1 [Paenibacillus sp. OAS669]
MSNDQEFNLTEQQERNRKAFYTDLHKAETTNLISKMLLIIGVVEIIAGIICGIYFGNKVTYELSSISGRMKEVSGFQFAVAIQWWVGSIIGGLVIIGFSEIIKLLQNISNILESK